MSDNFKYLSSIEISSLENPYGVGEVYNVVPQIYGMLDSGNDTGESFASTMKEAIYDKEMFYQKFRQGKEAGEDYYETGYNFFFITKPNLNLTSDVSEINTTDVSNLAKWNTSNNHFMYYVANNYPSIINSLNFNSTSNNVGNILSLLFNSFKGLSLDELSLESNNYYETMNGFNQSLGNNLSRSKASGSLSVTFNEYNIPEVTFLHKIWVEYIDNVKKGIFAPAQKTLENKEIDYVSSIYYFNVAPDGETITFWGRYLGA